MAGFGRRRSHLARRFGGVVLKEGDSISGGTQSRVQPLYARLSGCGCGVLDSVQQQIGIRHHSECHTVIREKTKSLLVLFESGFVLSESVIDNTKAGSKARIAGIDLFPKGIAPPCIHWVASYHPVIVSFDQQLIQLTHTSAQLECLPDIFCAPDSFTDGLVRVAQLVVGISKIGIKLNGSLKKRDSCRKVAALATETVGLQCLKRWSSGLLERCVVLLYGAQRLSKPPSHFRSGPPKRIENVAFVARLRFCARQQVSIRTVHSFENQNISSANQCNRTVQRCRAARPLTNFARDFRRESRVCRSFHHPQRLMDSFL